jgi:beta-phosphoglucomutase-like phosphatase (HAD superfamily)
LEKLGWKENAHFDALITADDVSESRPSPEMILLAMKNSIFMNLKKF